MYPRCCKFEHIIVNYSITQYYIRKITKKILLKLAENMFTLEQKIWIVQKCSSDPSHTVVRRMFMKKFAIKSKRANIFAEKRFLEVHNHFKA